MKINKYQAIRALYVAIIILCFSTVSYSQNIFEEPGKTISQGRIFHIESYDFNKDAKPDIVVSDYINPSRIIYNDGKGSFSRSEQKLNNGTRFAFGDLDNDGYCDLIIGNSIRINDGKGGFTKCQTISLQDIKRLWLADIDGDKDPDLFLSHRTRETRTEYLKLFLNVTN